MTNLLDLACAIQQIPAPTFHEHARAEFVRQQFSALGLADVEMDDLGNVYARRPSNGYIRSQGQARPLLVTAHTDTVFPKETPLTLTRTAERIAGPGIGDNSLGVAGLFGLAWALGDDALPGEVYFIANVGEEGLGDLKGMRAVMHRFGAEAQAIIVLEGMSLGRVIHGGIGVRRYRFTADTEGGHSWLNFGRPSAIHALMHLGAQLAHLEVPATPKTTFNIGVVSGGTSINTIARNASMDVDFRSEDPAHLDDLVARALALVASATPPGVQWETAVIGDRPAGSIPQTHPLVQQAARALQAQGIACVFESSSTDANIPLSHGWPCVCVGLGYGGHAHRPDEYIETRDIDKGLAALTTLAKSVWDKP